MGEFRPITARRHPPSAKLFFKEFLRDPKMIGSVVPTSRSAIRGLLDPMDLKHARCVVEYGPGTGVFTRELLRRMGPDTRLIAIDTNPVFIDHLRAALPDRRLTCVTGSAAQVETILARNGIAKADYVVSGLPFSTLPRAVAQDIMDATGRAVRPGGAFLIYQYSLFVLPMLQERFDRVQIGRIWRCVPPARLFWAWKGPEGLSRAAAAENLVAA